MISMGTICFKSALKADKLNRNLVRTDILVDGPEAPYEDQPSKVRR